MKGGVTVAIVLAIAIIVGIYMLDKAYNYKFKTRNTVSVAGSANYNFTADLIVWSASFDHTSMDIKEAYNALKSDAKQINDYLVAHGIDGKEIVFSSIDIDKLFESTYNQDGRLTGNVFRGYKLRQTVKIESKNIDAVEKISREITELLQSGIELSSQEPMYYYTKLSDLKLDLLAKASMDAYNRAMTIAKNAHSHLGNLRRANMGVFQITGQYSNESYTYSGAYNTSSKNKTANVIVRMEYELD
ncbi:MAG: SIMPL domain-containing protein [Bacteroidetes bacterium 46-16]|nr:MAG: SIMPL domain-containing protein [Bacteroidetes bacterium 46-16]